VLERALLVGLEVPRDGGADLEHVFHVTHRSVLRHYAQLLVVAGVASSVRHGRRADHPLSRLVVSLLPKGLEPAFREAGGRRKHSFAHLRRLVELDRSRGQSR
jgi:hypothetical protein